MTKGQRTGLVIPVQPHGVSRQCMGSQSSGETKSCGTDVGGGEEAQKDNRKICESHAGSVHTAAGWPTYLLRKLEGEEGWQSNCPLSVMYIGGRRQRANAA